MASHNNPPGSSPRNTPAIGGGPPPPPPPPPPAYGYSSQAAAYNPTSHLPPDFPRPASRAAAYAQGPEPFNPYYPARPPQSPSGQSYGYGHGDQPVYSHMGGNFASQPGPSNLARHETAHGPYHPVPTMAHPHGQHVAINEGAPPPRPPRSPHGPESYAQNPGLGLVTRVTNLEYNVQRLQDQAESGGSHHEQIQELGKRVTDLENKESQKATGESSRARSSAAVPATRAVTSVASGPGPGAEANEQQTRAIFTAIADIHELRGDLRGLQQRIETVERITSPADGEGSFASVFPHAEARVRRLEDMQEQRGEEQLARLERLERALAQATASRTLANDPSTFSSLEFAPKPGTKHGHHAEHDPDSDPEGSSRKRAKRHGDSSGKMRGDHHDDVPSPLGSVGNASAGGIMGPEKFLQILHMIDCREEAHLERLHAITSGPVSLEFPLFSNDKGEKVDSWFLKVGGKLRNQIRPHRREVFDVRVKSQKATEAERAKKLGWLECLLTGPKTIEAELPQYFVQLGEIYGQTKCRTGGVPDRVASTNFFVLLACEEKSLWIMFKYAENQSDDDGPSSSSMTVASRDVPFKCPFGVGKTFDTACLLKDVKTWKDPNQPILSGDRYAEFLRKGYSGLKPELILPLMADLEKHMNL